MNPFDILMILVNGIGWGIKPITEKAAVTKIGHSHFTFIRYIVTAIIAIPFLCYNLKQEGISSLFKKNPNFAFDAAKHGFIVSVVALGSIAANYYLLSKYDVSYIAPLVEGALLVMNAVFGIIFLKEKITVQAIMGIGIIIAGTFVLYSS